MFTYVFHKYRRATTCINRRYFAFGSFFSNEGLRKLYAENKIKGTEYSLNNWENIK